MLLVIKELKQVMKGVKFMKEYIIENCTKEEIDKLEQSDLDWYPDDIMGSDVCIYGTENDIQRAMKLIGRK